MITHAKELLKSVAIFIVLLFLVVAVMWCGTADGGQAATGTPHAPEATKQAKEQAKKPAKAVFSFYREIDKTARPLHYALSRMEYESAMKAMPLVEDIDEVDPNTQFTPLTIAAQDDSSDAYDMVKALVATYGADPNKPGKGFTPLHYAAYAGNFPVVEFLIERGADVNAVVEVQGCSDCEQITPLYLAYDENKPRIVELLKANGADLLDKATREELDLGNKLTKAMRYDPNTPEGMDPTAWRRFQTEQILKDMADIMRSEGRTAEAAVFDQIRPAFMKAMADTPRNGQSTLEWYQQVMAKALKEAGLN